jgi:hypothetical protein
MMRGWKAWRVLLGVLFETDAAKLDALLNSSACRDRALWRRLLTIANAHLVTGTLWSELKRKGLEPRVDVDAANYLAAFHEYNRARNSALLTQFHECIGALNAVGIEPMPLKGAAYLAANLYADPGARFLTDLDLLVPAEAVPVAVSAMQAIGFAAQPGGRTDFASHHHVAPLYRETDAAVVELHRAPTIARAREALPAHELWGRAIPEPRDASHRYFLPAPTDAALLSFLHTEIADRHVARCLIPLRALCDLDRLDAAHRDAIDWPANFRRAERIGAGAELKRYLYILRCVSGTAIGTEIGSNGGDALHYGMSMTAASWPFLIDWILRLDRWSGRATRNA